MLKIALPIVIAIAAATSVGAVTTEVDLDKSSVEADLSTASGFSKADYPVLEGYKNNTATGGDFRMVTIADGADGYKKLYVYLYHPSAAKLQFYDGTNYTDPAGYKIKIAENKNASYSRFDASLVSASADNTLLKFSVSCKFAYTASSIRTYDFSSFEILNSDSSKSNSYALGDRFTVSGDGSSKTLTHDVYDVLTLSPEWFAYVIPGVNNHSADVFGGATFSSSTSCYTTVYSGFFNVPESYGDMVGIRISWNAVQYVNTNNAGYTRQEIAGVSPKSMVVDYTDGDNQTVAAWDSKKAENASFLYKAWADWGHKGATAWDVPVIQKMDLLSNGKLYEDCTTGEQSKNPYALSETAGNKALAARETGSNQYIVHFDVRDYTATSSLSWGSFAGMWVTTNSVIKLLTGHLLDGQEGLWQMEDVSVLQLVMRKDGKKYVLAVSADSGSILVSSIDTSNADKPTDNSGILYIIRLIAVIAASVFAIWGFLEITRAMFSKKGQASSDESD